MWWTSVASVTRPSSWHLSHKGDLRSFISLTDLQCLEYPRAEADPRSLSCFFCFSCFRNRSPGRLGTTHTPIGKEITPRDPSPRILMGRASLAHPLRMRPALFIKRKAPRGGGPPRGLTQGGIVPHYILSRSKATKRKRFRNDRAKPFPGRPSRAMNEI